MKRFLIPSLIAAGIVGGGSASALPLAKKAWIDPVKPKQSLIC
jgi:hypothetical protein